MDTRNPTERNAVDMPGSASAAEIRWEMRVRGLAKQLHQFKGGRGVSPRSTRRSEFTRRDAASTLKTILSTP
jgi:hypothetical protein